MFVEPLDSVLNVLDEIEVFLGRVINTLDLWYSHETLVCHERSMFW